MKLTKNDIARIFGAKDKTPPEMELELAMIGATFTASSLCKMISDVLFVLDWRQEDVPNVIVKSDGHLYVKDIDEPYISIKIIRNIFRVLKFTALFDSALKEKNGKAIEEKLQKIIDKIGAGFKKNYRDNLQSMKWEIVCELLDAVKDRQRRLLASKI